MSDNPDVEKQRRYFDAKDDLTTFSPRQRRLICAAILEHILHGDEKHREWLRKELETFFTVY